MRVARLWLFLFLYALLIQGSQAQVSKYINSVRLPSSTEQGYAASVSIELLPNAAVTRATMHFRGFGITEYTGVEMLEAGRSFTATIPADQVQPPYVQFYFTLELEDGTTSTYPEVNPEINPLQLTVQQVDPREREVRFLAPEPGETVAQEDFVMALSLYYATAAVAPNKTKIFFDGTDISREAVLSDDVILWSAANSSLQPTLGSHTIRVQLFDTTGALYYTKERTFNLSTTAALVEEAERLQYNGDVRAEYRNEQTANAQTYARVETRVTGSYSFMKFGGNLRLDNLEDPSRQPQNRYFGYVDARYARLEVGDSYPTFPTLMMVGKRVRGITGAIKLGFFNLDVSVGKTKRAVQGTFLRDTTYTDSSAVLSAPENSIQKGINYFVHELFSPGTYSRDFFGIRPSFGSGENFQIGFTFMKFKDDAGSVRYNYRPKENLVVGTDLKFGFDDQRIRWETQAAVGLLNDDISTGNFTDADYDSLKAQGQDVKDIGKIAEQFITVNGNLNPINPAASGLPGIAVESFLTLNYFDNYVRAQFRRRGTAYKSFGNEFLQSDLQSMSVSDNVRLLSNKLFASVSYEATADNLSKSKAGTTTTGNLTTALTVNPGVGYPTVQVGVGLIGRQNDQTVFTPDSSRSSKASDDNATRYLFGLSYELRVPVRSFLTFNISSVDRKDQSIYRRDQQTSLLQGSVTSFYSIPLQTTISFLTSTTQSTNQLFASTTGADSLLSEANFKFSSVSVGAQYRLLEDHLRLSTQITPTFGDVARTALRFGVDYSIAAHVFELLYDYYNNTDTRDDSILSFVYRFNF